MVNTQTQFLKAYIAAWGTMILSAVGTDHVYKIVLLIFSIILFVLGSIGEYAESKNKSHGEDIDVKIKFPSE